MPFHYRCGVCRTTSPIGSRAAAEGERERHRQRVHGGQIPDFESIEPAAYDRSPRALLRSLLWIAALILLDWLRRHL